MSEIELGPCPYCSSINLYANRSFGNVTCLVCGASAPKRIWNTRSHSERVSRLEEALRGLIEAIDDLTGNSSGVSGLHMNGDLAPWDELLNDGRYTEWLGDPLNAARSALNQGADNGR